MRSALNSSAVWELTAEGERLFHCGIVRGKKEFFRASLYVWYLQYWALCDDLVDFKLRAGVRYLSFSIDTAPECILWKRSREDWSLRASRDGHSSSSSISPTLLVLRHLLQVQLEVSEKIKSATFVFESEESFNRPARLVIGRVLGTC